MGHTIQVENSCYSPSLQSCAIRAELYTTFWEVGLATQVRVPLPGLPLLLGRKINGQQAPL